MKRMGVLFLVASLLFCTACVSGQAGTMTATPAPTPTLEQLLDDALRLMNEGRYEEAILAYEGMIAIEPKRAASYIALADLLQTQGDTAEALEAIDRGLAENKANNELLEKYYAIKREAAGRVDWRADMQTFLEAEITRLLTREEFERVNVYLEDLDFDGLPEAFVIPDHGGSGSKLNIQLYSCGENGVREIDVNGAAYGSEESMTLQLYQDITTGKLCFLSETGYGDMNEYHGRFEDRMQGDSQMNSYDWVTESIMRYDTRDGDLVVRDAAYWERIEYYDIEAVDIFAQVDGRDVPAERYDEVKTEYLANLEPQFREALKKTFSTEEMRPSSIAELLDSFIPFDVQPLYMVADTASGGATAEAVSPQQAEQAYYSFIKDTLLPQYGLSDLEYINSYWEEGLDYDDAILKSLGLMSAHIENMDEDNIPELIALITEKDNSDVYLHIYTLKNGKVVELNTNVPRKRMASIEFETDFGASVYIVSYKGKKYIFDWNFIVTSRSNSIWSVQSGKLVCELDMTYSLYTDGEYNVLVSCDVAPPEVLNRIKGAKTDIEWMDDHPETGGTLYYEYWSDGYVTYRYDAFYPDAFAAVDAALSPFGIRKTPEDMTPPMGTAEAMTKTNVPALGATMRLLLCDDTKGWVDHTNLRELLNGQ